MAEKKQIDLEIKNNLDDVNNKVEDIVDSLKDLKEGQDKVTKSVEDTENATKGLAKGFKGVGLALKAAGIGLAVEAFNQFKDVLVSNQGVADKLNISLGATKKVFGDLITTVTSLDKLKEVFASIGNGTFTAKTAKYLTGVVTTSTKQVELAKEVQKAIAEQQGLIEQGDARAERYRQIRDNENLSIETRIKANENLGTALNEQAAAMTLLANKQKELADLNLEITKNTENEVAVIEAKNNLNAIDAQITGLKSEQIINEISLIKERDSIDIAAQDSAIARGKSRLETNITLIKDEAVRRNIELFELRKTSDIELKLLDERRKKYAENTDARAQADELYRTRKQEFENLERIKSDEYITYQENSVLNSLNFVYTDELESFSLRLAALDEFNKVAQNSTQMSEEQKRQIALDTLNEERKIQNQRLDLVKNTLGNIGSLFESTSTEGKAFAIAQSLINTYQGITAELATKTATPFEFGLKVANIAATAAIGFKAVKDIISTNPSSSGGGFDSSSAGITSAAPQFNVVGASGINQVAQTINKQANTPVKAYVVSKDVTTAQSLDRNIVNSASM